MLLPFLSSPSREQTRSLRCLNSRISKIFLPELPVKLQLFNRDDLSVSLARYSLAVVWRHLNKYCICSFSCAGSFYLWQRVWAAFVFIGLAPLPLHESLLLFLQSARDLIHMISLSTGTQLTSPKKVFCCRSVYATNNHLSFLPWLKNL